MMTVITIMWFLVMTVAIPYMFYQNKAKVKVTQKELSQILYEGRNMATNGFSSGNTNQSIWLFFDTENNKWKITFLSFPYAATGSDIRFDNPSAQVIKNRELEPWMQIDSIGGKKKVLFFFSAVYGEWHYYSWNSSNIREDITSDEIPFIFSYKWSWTGSLQSTLTYFTKTNIVDY